jgi:FkbM family methyltransferase
MIERATTAPNAQALPLTYRLGAEARRLLGSRATRFVAGSPLARPLRLVLGASAPTGVSMVEVCGGRLQGARMLIDLSCEKYYWLGTHEPHVQDLLAEIVRPGMVVYDVGAHAGFFSLLCAQLAGSHGAVHAFEPRLENAYRLRENAAANRAEQIVVHAVALSDSAGEAAFVALDSTLEGYLAAPGESAADAVPTDTVDRLVDAALPPPELLKLDVEGAEALVIRGAARTIAAHRPLLLIEVHFAQAGREVVAALPVPYEFTDVKTGAVVAPPIPAGHYLARPVG